MVTNKNLFGVSSVAISAQAISHEDVLVVAVFLLWPCIISNVIGAWAKAGEHAKEQYKGKGMHKLDLLQKRIYRPLMRKPAINVMKVMKASKAKPTQAATKAMKKKK